MVSINLVLMRDAEGSQLQARPYHGYYALVSMAIPWILCLTNNKGIPQCWYVFEMEFADIIGASVSEPPLVDSTDALSCTIYIYIYTSGTRYCVCAALRANVAGRIGN